MPVTLQFYSNKLLFNSGKLAMDPRCCCGCTYDVEVLFCIAKDNPPPPGVTPQFRCDLNVKRDGSSIHTYDSGCGTVITDDFTDTALSSTHTWDVVVDTHSATCPNQGPDHLCGEPGIIRVKNNGSTDICVNSTTVHPGDGADVSFNPTIDGTTTVSVSCGACP